MLRSLLTAGFLTGFATGLIANAQCLQSVSGAWWPYRSLQPHSATDPALYPPTVLVDQPLAYLRFSDSLLRTNVFGNIGSLGFPGNAINSGARPFSGAFPGSSGNSQFFNGASWARIPWNALINPPNTQPFTIEAWLYPTSDQINGGQSVLMNRYSYPGVNRQGWILFQRAPNDSYAGKPGYEGVGWNFRMYRGAGSSSGLDVTSGVPYKVGTWNHVVVVYDPVDGVRPTLTMYVNGVAAATTTWTGDGPGYVANTADHPASEAPDGPAGLALGAYNNTSPGSNPYFGAIDAFAMYGRKLSAAQIRAHYDNGTNAAPPYSYCKAVNNDDPVVYLYLDELSDQPPVTLNLGDLRGAGDGIPSAEVVQSVPSALAGPQTDTASRFHHRNGSAVTSIPFRPENNPDAGRPFTLEAWLRPTSDRQNPGAAPIANRYVKSGNRTGWTLFQRAPNSQSAGADGVGWNFRMYTGAGGGGQDVVTGVPYKVGEWQHLVVTWTPLAKSGTTGAKWTGTLTAYVNGERAASKESALYTANTEPTEDDSPASDLAVGAYNAASGLGSNPFEGDIDEVAFYGGYLLKPEQIRSHYRAGTNALGSATYANLVLMAANDGTGTQRSMPATYLRFGEPALFPAVNLGTLGKDADGSLVMTRNDAPGPRPVAFPGMPEANLATPFDGTKAWIDLNNPDGLNFTGRITMEAWIKPSITSGVTAAIVSHQATTGGDELSLAITSEGAYAFGVTSGLSFDGALAPIPQADLAGGNWVHLVGTHTGTAWKLYRNGTLLASSASLSGALRISNGNWAIGSMGNGWENLFTGAIDEVALYGKTLSADQVLAHYKAAVNGIGPAPPAVSLSAGKITLTWSSGTLQQAETLGGTFVDLPNITSPYVVPANTLTRMFRIRE